MDTFVLRSMYKGCISRYFWCIAWAVTTLFGYRWASAFIQTFEYRMDRDFCNVILAVVSIIAAIVTVMVFVNALFYLPRQVNTFHTGENNLWKKVTETSFGFPFGMTVSETYFDRIIRVRVDQSSMFDRIFNTESLYIKMVTFTNGEVVEEERTIPAVESPFESQKKILESLPGHTGIEVRLSKQTA